MSSKDFETRNLFLNLLDRAALDRLSPHLSRVEFEQGKHFSMPGDTVQHVHFPEGGVVSCVAVSGGSRTEVGLIGAEGMVGFSALLGDDVAQFETMMQVGPATTLAGPVPEMRRAMEESAQLRSLVGRYLLHFLLQVSHTIIAHTEHLMEGRLARWLLMCHDRVEGEEIRLTHDFMATMIAAQRSGVTVTLHLLEGTGAIRSTRGLVTIRDREKLLEIAGDSYGKPEARYRELLGPFGK
jgi:CRP-like cAMP-binding protein